MLAEEEMQEWMQMIYLFLLSQNWKIIACIIAELIVKLFKNNRNWTAL